MRFILFTDKKVLDCVSAINERLQAPASGSRPGLDGWIEKRGSFALAIDSPVLGRFVRQTRLEALVEREGDTTVIRGQVPGGASPGQQRLLIGGVIALCAFMLIQGEALVAMLAAVMGGILYIPLRGDYDNSEKLLIEVERTLKASPKVPKGLPSSVLSKPLPRPITTRPRGQGRAGQDKNKVTARKPVSAAARKATVKTTRPVRNPAGKAAAKPGGAKGKPTARPKTTSKPTPRGTSTSTRPGTTTSKKPPAVTTRTPFR